MKRSLARKYAQVFIVAFGLLSGCGAIVAPQSDAGRDAPDAQVSADAGSQVVQCFPAPVSFPSFDRRCSTRDDCTMVLHMTDCCGTLQAIGIRNGEVPAFTAAEAQCQMQYPGCGCAGRGVLDDDNQPSRMGRDGIVVNCVSGSCRTSVTGG